MNFRLKETHSCPTIAALTYGTRQCSNALEHAREVAEYGYCLREEVAGRMAISQKRRNRGSPTPLGHLGLTFSRAWVFLQHVCVEWLSWALRRQVSIKVCEGICSHQWFGFVCCSMVKASESMSIIGSSVQHKASSFVQSPTLLPPQSTSIPHIRSYSHLGRSVAGQSPAEPSPEPISRDLTSECPHL